MLGKIFKFKKLILITLILLSSFFILSKPSLAYTGVEGPSYFIEFEEALGSDDMNLQSFVNETFKAVGGSIFNLLIGPIKWAKSIGDPDAWFSQNPSQFSGLIPTSIILFTGFYQQAPASGIQYFADLGKKIGIVKPAYAQAKQFSTFQSMKFILPIWTIFRNISYLLFVLILVAMGFAIMFRVKISPQAVITIQSALPRIVIALILITFSYAIVGLILDVGMFINSMIGAIFKDVFEKSFGDSGLITAYEKISAALSPEEVHELVRPFAVAFIYGQLATTGFFLGSIAMAGPTLLLSIVFFLIIGILLFIAYLRALWTLVRAFAMIVINIIFAPLRILFGVMPGNNAMIDWFKDLFANVAILPGMLTLYFIGNYLILEGVVRPFEMLATGEAKGFGLYAGFWMLSGMIVPIIGIFILLMIPKVADIIQSFITKKPFQYGTAIGESLSAPGRAASTMFGFATRAADGALTISKVRDKYRKKVADVDANKDGNNDMPLIE